MSFIFTKGNNQIRLEGKEGTPGITIDLATPSGREVHTNDAKAIDTGALPILRNHLHWVTGILLALCSLALLEIANDNRLMPTADYVSQIEQYAYKLPIGDAIYDMSWLAILTSGWLLTTTLEGTLCLLIPEDIAFLNMAAVEWAMSSALAGNWFYQIFKHGRIIHLLWSLNVGADGSKTVIYFVGYLSVSIAGLLFLNAFCIFDGCCCVALQQDVGFFQVAMTNLNALGQSDDELPAEDLLQQAEEGCVEMTVEKGSLHA